MENNFTFAGFNFPRKIYQMPKGKLKARLGKNISHAVYYSQPTPRNVKDSTNVFYFESDFSPGLRWTWCDEVEGTRIDHKGWYCDDSQSEVMRGFVMRLPNEKGFLAGCTIGEGCVAYLDLEPHSSEREAAHVADRMAESIADEWKREEEKENASQRVEECRERIAEIKVEIKAALVERKQVKGLNTPTLCGMLTHAVHSLIKERKSLKKEILALEQTYGGY